MEPEVSVVIPTYNRMDVLPEVLAALEGQQGAPPFEVLVVDDGSTDGTGDWLDQRHFTLPTQVLHQPNAGPARARNRGVAAARGRWVAFLGDDTVPSPGWLAAHRGAHRRHGDSPELAVIGYTRWHQRMRLTPFLDYINEYGLQFGYALIEDPDDVPFNFFYTSNLSLHRQRLLDEPFDEGFPYAAWEDIEAAYRLRHGGLRLIYEASAVVLHDHPTDLARFAQRQEKAGYSAVVFYLRHPEMAGFLGLGPDGPPPPLNRWAQRLRGGLARTLQNTPVKMPALWQEWLRGQYILGLHRGWHHEVEARRSSTEGG